MPEDGEVAGLEGELVRASTTCTQKLPRSRLHNSSLAAADAAGKIDETAADTRSLCLSLRRTSFSAATG
jgi:hypothetical protein